MFYIALGCFLLAVGWLLWVLVVLRPKGQAWHNRQVLRKYRAQELRDGYGRK